MSASCYSVVTNTPDGPARKTTARRTVDLRVVGPMWSRCPFTPTGRADGRGGDRPATRVACRTRLRTPACAPPCEELLVTIVSPYPDVVVPDQSVFDYVLGSLTADELRTVAVVAVVRTLTYAELVEQVLRVAGALAARGVRPGDVVALHAPNSAAFVALFHAILRAGATVTTVNSL